MKHHWLIASLCITACFGAAKRPGARAAGDGVIEQTISGGRWQTSATTAGNYRVTVRRFEEPNDRRYAILQWIQDVGDGVEVGRDVNLNEVVHAYGLKDPTIARRGQLWFLQVRAAIAPHEEYDSNLEFVLGDPGTVSLVCSSAVRLCAPST